MLKNEWNAWKWNLEDETSESDCINPSAFSFCFNVTCLNCLIHSKLLFVRKNWKNWKTGKSSGGGKEIKFVWRQLVIKELNVLHYNFEFTLLRFPEQFMLFTKEVFFCVSYSFNVNRALLFLKGDWQVRIY